jgi:surface antigen
VPRLTRALVTLACLLLASGLCVGVAAAPASAALSYLCTTYRDCRAQGMSSDGYAAVNDQMYWQMYPGHNCTNYAAYRMIESGLPNERPWEGRGNAQYWGQYRADLTDSTPRVGAVAWWDANVKPAGSAGHVAYVERVVSRDTIVVSQDSWGGTFSWARITRGTGYWPSGFIHFHDVPLRNTLRPTVSGTPKVGEVLTASSGSWTPTPSGYRYRWFSDDVAIPKATDPTLRVRLAQKNTRISVRVTASRVGYPATSATSAHTALVKPAVIANLAPPVVSGEPRVDSTLTVLPGTWEPDPTALDYQWHADGTPIPYATESTLTPGPALVGKALSVTVTARKYGYTPVSKTSARTAPVQRANFVPTDPPTLTGAPHPGETLTLERGHVTPADAAPTVQWLRAGVPIDGAEEPTYVLRRADLGSRIVARVTHARDGYNTLVTRSDPTRRVQSVSTLHVRTDRSPRRLHLAVRVTARGVLPVPGTVVVTSRRTVLKTLRLRSGEAATTLRGLSEGYHTFTIKYAATETVTGASLTRTVRIF